MNRLLRKFTWTPELEDVIEECKGIFIPTTKSELYEMVFGTGRSGKYDVVYDVPGKGEITEATVVRAKNGVCVNYAEDYMRRRDPDCMRIADDKPTDKPRFKDVYGYDFDDVRKETLEWLKTQELIIMPFNSGGNIYGYKSMLICPRNAAFFAFALAQLQGFVSAEDTEGYKPRAIIYVAYITAWRTATRSIPTTSIPARPRRRAFILSCSISANRKAGSRHTLPQPVSPPSMIMILLSCMRVLPAAARVKCSRMLPAWRTTASCLQPTRLPVKRPF